MHPPLQRPHPDCQHVVDALMACHDEHPYAKFWGACNDAKVALDRCFRVEKEDRRKANSRGAPDMSWAKAVAEKEGEHPKE